VKISDNSSIFREGGGVAVAEISTTGHAWIKALD
jgi:hypothetical protein